MPFKSDILIVPEFTVLKFKQQEMRIYEPIEFDMCYNISMVRIARAVCAACRICKHGERQGLIK